MFRLNAARVGRQGYGRVVSWPASREGSQDQELGSGEKSPWQCRGAREERPRGTVRRLLPHGAYPEVPKTETGFW